ncbi:MAG: insulinase family protein [Nitrospirota bacterium]|nr:insulinase family protein [Nitrospirota bacterium]
MNRVARPVPRHVFRHVFRQSVTRRSVLRTPWRAVRALPVLAVLATVVTLSGWWGGGALAADLKVQRETLPNGLTLQVVQRQALPIVSVQLAVLAGTRNDPEGAAGTAALTAALLNEGTATRSSTEIAEAVEFVGASLGAGAQADYATISFSGLQRNLDMGMDLLADISLRPAFRQDDVERLRKETIAGIISDEDQPGSVAAKAFDRELFGSHPYAQPAAGTVDSVEPLGPEALAAFHKRHYVPDGAVISFVGDVSFKDARKLVLRHFGKWSGRQPPAASPPVAVAPAKVRVVTIDRPVTQANVIMGHLGIRRTDADFYPLQVMNYILGGGTLTSRLGDSVREKQGLAYSVYSSFDSLRDPGSFTVNFQTKNASANQAIASTLVEIRRIREQPVAEQELADAKNYLTGSFPLRLDTNGKTAGLLTFSAMYGLGENYFTDYPQAIQAVTAADVQRVARQYLHPDAMLWVVVANQKEAAIAAP